MFFRRNPTEVLVFLAGKSPRVFLSLQLHHIYVQTGYNRFSVLNQRKCFTSNIDHVRTDTSALASNTTTQQHSTFWFLARSTAAMFPIYQYPPRLSIIICSQSRSIGGKSKSIGGGDAGLEATLSAQSCPPGCRLLALPSFLCR